MKKRLFTVLLGMAVLLQSGSFKSAASVDSVQLHEFFTEDKQVDYCAEKPIHLFCKNEDEKVYSHGTIIKSVRFSTYSESRPKVRRRTVKS